MAAIQLSKRVWQVNGLNPGPFTLQGTNTYILGTGLSRILIDTGDGHQPQYTSNLKALLQNQLGNARISAILLTHHHPDHAGGLSNILNEEGITTEDFKLFSQPGFVEPSAQASENFVPIGIFKQLNSELDAGFLEKATVKYQMRHINTVEPDTNGGGLKLDQILSDKNFSINVEGASVYAIPTPGHCEDHITYYLKEEHALFSGDCVLGNSSTIFNDLKKLIGSLTTILNVDPAVIYPGHGTVIDSPRTEVQKNIDHRIVRENKILDIIKQHTRENTSDQSENISSELIDQQIAAKFIDLHELFLRVYGPLQGEKLVRGAKYNLINHLNKLEDEKRVVIKLNSNGDKLWASL